MNIKKGTITVVDSADKLNNYQVDGKVIIYTGETTGNVKSNTMYCYSSYGKRCDKYMVRSKLQHRNAVL